MYSEISRNFTVSYLHLNCMTAFQSFMTLTSTTSLPFILFYGWNMVESGHDRKEKDGSDLSQGPCQVLHHRCNYQLHLWKWEKLRNCWAKFQKTLFGTFVVEMWLSKSMRAMWWQKTWPLPGPQLLVDLRCTSHREENGNSFQHVRVLPGHTQSFGLGPHSANLYLATGIQRLQPILETGSPPTLTTADISHGGDVHSPTAGARLTHLRALAAHFTPLALVTFLMFLFTLPLVQ